MATQNDQPIGLSEQDMELDIHRRHARIVLGLFILALIAQIAAMV